MSPASQPQPLQTIPAAHIPTLEQPTASASPAEWIPYYIRCGFKIGPAGREQGDPPRGRRQVHWRSRARTSHRAPLSLRQHSLCLQDFMAVDDDGTSTEVRAQLDAWLGPVDTPRWRSPRRGFHVLLRQPPGVQLHSIIGQVAPKLDIKAGATDYVLAPSTRPGGTYKLEGVDLRWVAECPASLLDAVLGNQTSSKRYKSGSSGLGRVSREQRWTRSSPCPVCGGCPQDPRGRRRGLRCWGFLASDGLYAHCTREEDAGAVPPKPSLVNVCAPPIRRVSLPARSLQGCVMGAPKPAQAHNRSNSRNWASPKGFVKRMHSTLPIYADLATSRSMACAGPAISTA
jgi:hypothetical protein